MILVKLKMASGSQNGSSHFLKHNNVGSACFWTKLCGKMKVLCILLRFPFSPLLWSCESTGLHLLPGAIWLPWWIFMDNKVVTIFHWVLLMLIPKPEIYLGIDCLVSWDSCICLSLFSSLTWLEKLLEGGDLGRPAQTLVHFRRSYIHFRSSKELQIEKLKALHGGNNLLCLRTANKLQVLS